MKRWLTVWFFISVFGLLSIVGLASRGLDLLKTNQQWPSLNQTQVQQLANKAKQRIDRANYQDDRIKSVGVSAYAQVKTQQVSVINRNGIGRLYIPQATVKLPILAGMTDANLLSGVATYSASQRLGYGNYVVLSHNIFGSGIGLAYINQLQKGDMAYATNYNYVYHYKVISNQVVKEDQVQVLDPPKTGQPAIMTIFRCEGPEGTIWRRVVQAEYTGYQTFQTEQANILHGLGIDRTTQVKTQPVAPVNQAGQPLSWLDSLSVKVAAVVLRLSTTQLILLISGYLLVPLAIMVLDQKLGTKRNANARK